MLLSSFNEVPELTTLSLEMLLSSVLFGVDVVVAAVPWIIDSSLSAWTNITIKIVVFLIFCYAGWTIYKRLKYRCGYICSGYFLTC